MNEKYPSRSLNGQAPLQAYPEAKKNVRSYQIGQEKHLANVKRLETFLSQYVWYRKISKIKTLSLNSKHYYLNKSSPQTYLSIRYSIILKKMIFHDANELWVQELLVKDFAINLLEQKTIPELLEMRKKNFNSENFPL